MEQVLCCPNKVSFVQVAKPNVQIHETSYYGALIVRAEIDTIYALGLLWLLQHSSTFISSNKSKEFLANILDTFQLLIANRQQ